MDIGLSKWEPGDGKLATRLGATWGHQFAFLDDGTPDLRETLAEMLDAGCKPVFDCRTSMEVLSALLYDPEGKPHPDRQPAFDWYAGEVLAFLDLHLAVHDVELWASPECPMLAPGQCLSIDYGGLLSAVYAKVKAERPDVTVWTGGFGTMADTRFLAECLCGYSPRAFDVCNMHPCLTPQGDLEEDLGTLREGFARARALLDERCGGQPLRSTAFGVPTTHAGRPDPTMGQFHRSAMDKQRLLPEEEALPWWEGSLREMAVAGFEAVCLLARDWRDPADRSQNHSGLLRRNGQEKAFLGALVEALPEVCNPTKEKGGE